MKLEELRQALECNNLEITTSRARFVITDMVSNWVVSCYDETGFMFDIFDTTSVEKIASILQGFSHAPVTVKATPKHATTPSTRKRKGVPPKGTAARVPTTVRLDPAVRAWLKAKGEGQRNDVLNSLCFAQMAKERDDAPSR